MMYLPVITALFIGALGGGIASWVNLPLPWMLGPMIACLGAVLAGFSLKAPIRVRPIMVTVLGVLLGSGFTPDIFSQIADWAVSIAALILYMSIAALLAYPYLRKIAGYDPVTAYFCGMPGGVTEMVMIGGSYGGDEQKIALVHASRILITVISVPIAFRWMEGIDTIHQNNFTISVFEIPIRDLVILGMCGAFGWGLGKGLKLPAGALLGPMLISAAAHLTGITTASPPFEMVNIAQWVIGTTIGCRFLGVERLEIVKTIMIAIGGTALLLGMTVIFAALLSSLAGLDPRQIILAYAPGGLAEMSLVALALGGEAAFVAVHHSIRISVVVFVAPLIFKRLRTKTSDPDMRA